ncbi:MAG: redoxin domain-containing protein [Kiritimatiellae bacterium]|nr:redoxin domain-containing protein [Kiritimatiellia bacterium]
MSEFVPIRGFPSYEEARVAAQRLDAIGIASQIDAQPSGAHVLLRVDPSHAARAGAALGEAGFDPPLALVEPGEAQPAVSVVEAVEAQIETMRARKRGLLRNLGTLLITLLLFVSLGLFRATPSGIAIIVLVLLVHEFGHFLGMKLFGYRDVRMFFIPLLGAAVSGSETNPSGGRKAVVSLLGPLPGIVAGIALAVVYFATQEPFILEAARAFLFINGFNLLPFYPLDGGHFLEHVLFSRSPRVEMIFKVLTLIALAGVAWLLRSLLLGFFAFTVFSTLGITRLTARLAAGLRKEYPPSIGAPAAQVPRDVLERIVPQMQATLPAQKQTPQALAAIAQEVWRKAHERPPRVLATVLLLLLYAGSLFVGLVAPFAFEGVVYALDRWSDYEVRLAEDGRTVVAETQYAGGTKVAEVELNAEGCYDGVVVFYGAKGEGTRQKTDWKDGYRHATWEETNERGEVVQIVEYDTGRVTRFARLVDGRLADIPRDEWPALMKSEYRGEPMRSPEFDVYSNSLTAVGQRLPDFAARTLDGQSISSDDLRGKVAWIHFTTLKHRTARNATAYLGRYLWAKHHGPDFVFLAIARDDKEEPVRQFAESKEFTFPVAADPDRSVYTNFAVGYIPRDYLVGRDGVIVEQSAAFRRGRLDRMIAKAEELLGSGGR